MAPTPVRQTATVTLRDGTTRHREVPLPPPAAVVDSLVTGRAGAYSTVHVVYAHDEPRPALHSVHYAYVAAFTACGLPRCSACGAQRGLTLYVRDADAAHAARDIAPATPRLCETCYLAAELRR